MNKIEKIKAEIKRLREIQCSPMLLCDDLLSFIDYIQEEPVSEDFEEQVKALWNELNTGHTYSIIGSYNIFYGLCLDIADWQKEQFEKERLKHYNELTPEQAQIVSDFVTQHLDEHIICGCSNVEHSIFFSTIEGDDDVYMSIHLVPLPFFERLVNGIRYIFGHRSKYGDFDEIIITKKDVGKVEKVVRWLNQNHNPIDKRIRNHEDRIIC